MSENKIGKRNVEYMVGLTSMQEGMLFHYLSNPRSKQYFEQIRLTLSGEMDLPRFKKAWGIVSEGNEVLRGVFRWEKLEEPVQIILKQKEIPVRVTDFSLEYPEDQESPGKQLNLEKHGISSALLEKLIEEDKNQPIDLTREPFRITLCRTTENESEMLLTFHHILFDGWSSGVLLREFLQAYNALGRGETPAAVTKTQYREFFKWYQDTQTQQTQSRQEFWKKYLEGFDTRTLLPYDKNKLAEIQRVKTHQIEIPHQVKEKLEACAQENNITLSTLLYAAWGILLQKYNNTDDVMFGVTVSGRTPQVKGIDRMVGLFINTLPLRLKTHGDNTAAEVFRYLGQHLEERDRYGYEHTSLTAIKPLTDLDKESNLFDSIVVIDNYPLDNLLTQPSPGRETGKSLEIFSYEAFEMTNYDITIQVMLMEKGSIAADFHYHAGVFEEETVRRMTGHYINILAGLAGNSSAALSEIPMLSAEEKKQVLEEFNQPSIEMQVEKTIHGVILDQVERVPGNRAVQYEDQWLTYREFNRRANQLARMLKEYGVEAGIDSRVAMILPRSIDMIVVLMGILKAGAACIPLDIAYPGERNRFIIKDSEAKLLLTSRGVGYDAGETTGGTVVPYDWEKLKDYPADNLDNKVLPGDLSYIIYTSGSTGNPKGALLHHSGIVNHTETKIGVLGITGKDTVANNFSINVIASVWQILSPLFCGARLMLYSEEVEWDPYLQFQRVEADGVTVIEVIPSVLKAYLFTLEEGQEKIPLAGLRKVALTSEETKPVLVNKFYRIYTHIDMVDCYGQTECCDDVLHYTIPHDTETWRVPIGTPSLNTNVFILNHHDQLQPVGVSGEICVIGAGVAYGYWKRPELTAEKFCLRRPGNLFEKRFPGPSQNFCLEEETLTRNTNTNTNTMYRTGDLGRWLPDGRVEYLGRIDHQVKIRGNRVELREIENHLLRYPALKEAAVVVKEDREGEKNLYAFVISDREITVADLRQYLLKTLPDYMVPAYFVRMEKLPLTPNGKIDRKALVKAEVKGIIAAGSEYKPPRSVLETKIQEIWSRLLDKEKGQIGVNDNFFDLGGHSLMLIKLKSKLEKVFELTPDRQITIAGLFGHPTIAHQARWIDEKMGGKGEEGAVTEPQTGEMKQKKDRGLNREIAVIGIALRVPGATGIRQFWKNLTDGVEVISFFHEEELEKSEGYRVLEGEAEFIRAAGVMGEIDYFDADFFGCPPREAEIMDPQQRVFLEDAWRALEDAGYAGETYPGAVGVYAGVGWNTYLLNHVLANPEVIKTMGEFQTMIGNEKDFLATRVSYKLNLKGPSLTVQTACSTSLVAVHMARQSLLNGDCDMALAGGIVARGPEKTGYFYTEGGHLSPDGHCRPFDALGKGTVFSNGIGIVVLKRLEEARADRDHIYAVIKGSAINNDGSLKVGFTSPSEIQQSRVIAGALEDAGVDPTTIGYIETHGTGTTLGDPVEISALTLAYRQRTRNRDGNGTKNQYCAIGSIKSNLGHLDIAAGIIGFIKAVLCLKHKQIPPSIHFEQPNPIIDFVNSPFYVNHILKEWTGDQVKIPRRAGVSALGIGGTNVHVVLEEWPAALGQGSGGVPPLERSRQNHIILLSAKTETALEQISRNLAEYFQPEGANLADAAYTMQVGRARFPYRKMYVAAPEGMKETIEVLTGPNRLKTYTVEPGDKPIVFMFTGQGSQYVNMGRGLYRSEPVFREEMDRCFEILKPLLSCDIKEVLYPSDPSDQSDRSDRSDHLDIDRTGIAQPLLFVFEYALAKLIMKWGITPYAMIGHSIGEYVAASISGVIGLEEALNLVAARGHLMQGMAPGAMISVAMPGNQVESLLASHRELSLAAVNTPALAVVSGPYAAIDAFERQLKEKGHESTRLHTSHAFHSAMMDPMLKPFAEKFKGVKMQSPGIPYLSNVTGDWIKSGEAVDPAYWVTHVRQTVRYADGMEKLLGIDSSLLIEVGPGNVLSTFARKHPGKKENQGVIELVRHPKKKIPDMEYLVNALGQMWQYGVEIDWKAYHEGEERSRIPLPAYPFERKRYWLQEAEKERGRQEESARETSPQRGNLEEWFYIPTWKQSVLQEAEGKTEAGGRGTDEKEKEKKSWLIFLDEEEGKDRTGLGRRVIARLHRQREDIEIIGVIIGKQYGKRTGNGGEEYILTPGRYEDYAAMWEDLQNRGKTVGKIIHMWTINAPFAYERMERGVYSLMHLVKSMGRQNIFSPTDLRVVSEGMHHIESGDKCNPENASLQGPCTVIPQEYPNIACSTIEIQGEQAEQDLVEELITISGERTVAYRGNQRWEQMYEPIKIPRQEGVPGSLRTRGVYLIIGGMGNIGLTWAEYLAQTVRARLILTTILEFPARDRWGAPEHEEAVRRIIDRVRKIEEKGAEVLILRADAGEKEQMQQVIARAEEQFGTLDGVIHAAGLVNERYFKTISDLEKEDCELHFKSKIQGLNVLEEVLTGKSPDFCLLNSSLSSVLGGLTLYAYSAANGYMDAFAREQSRRPGKWISIDWDEWEKEKYRGKKGGHPGYGETRRGTGITPGEGKEVIHRVFSMNKIPRVIISTGDLNRRLRQWVLGSPDTGKEKTPKKSETPTGHKRPDVRSVYEAPGSEAEKIVAEVWEKLLGIESIGVQDDFFELGGHSLLATKLVSRLRDIFRIDLPLNTFFDKPTIRDVVGNIIQTWGDKETVEEIAQTYREVQMLSQ